MYYDRAPPSITQNDHPQHDTQSIASQHLYTQVQSHHQSSNRLSISSINSALTSDQKLNSGHSNISILSTVNNNNNSNISNNIINNISNNHNNMNNMKETGEILKSDEVPDNLIINNNTSKSSNLQRSSSFKKFRRTSSKRGKRNSIMSSVSLMGASCESDSVILDASSMEADGASIVLNNGRDHSNCNG